MTDIPEIEKLEIKIMAEYLFKQDMIRFCWVQKFFTAAYLQPGQETQDAVGEDHIDLLYTERTEGGD